jgi:uncharacterized surface protein with fasciclin (FAS1) repeats
VTGVTRLLSLVAVAAAAVSLAAGTATARPLAQRDLVQTAVAAGQFKTLAKLLTRAGLVSALEQPGPYTVFAPTDAAFARVPAKTLKALLADKARLRAVLLYHVVKGRVTAAEVAKLSTVKTLEGAKVRLRVTGSHVFVDQAKVTRADVMASNGVIHAVDRVLIPPTG